ncbi:hypothetical protein TNIN_232381, partial [Trichonephila inaurata madagascariensis]
ALDFIINLSNRYWRANTAQAIATLIDGVNKLLELPDEIAIYGSNDKKAPRVAIVDSDANALNDF